MVQGVKNQQLQDTIVKALSDNQFCSFATVESNKPHVRYMALFNDGLTIYLATNKKTHKVEELQQNPHIHLIAGFDGKRSSVIVQVEGTARISKDESLKEKIWQDDFKQWFEGKQDPNYVIIEISPTRIEYSDGDNGQPAVWEA
jgi:general stress protein 26